MSELYPTEPKRTAEQLNLWFSPSTGQWVTCAWIPIDVGGGIYSKVRYEKERVPHPDFPSALKFIQNNYVGRHS